jgi:hypothetical protein
MEQVSELHTHCRAIFKSNKEFFLNPMNEWTKMIMTGRYKVTGHFFSSSVFNSFAFVLQNGQTEKNPKYKGKINSAGTDFDNFVRNRLPH